MNDDLLIRQAMLDAALADFPQADLPEAPSFSPKYLAWERKFLRSPQAFAQRTLRPMWQTTLRSAACFLLVVSLSFASLMAFSPQARAWVASWFTEWHEDHVTYRFTGETLPTEALRDWAPTYLPDGYVQTDFIDLPGVVSILYNNDDPTMEIEFSYQLLTEGGGEHLDNERHTPSPITIRGMQGEFWEATDGSQNFLVWFDEESKHAFLLMSRQPKNELIKIAESVEPIH